MATPISVVIPVGPKQHHRRWLGHAIKSARTQKPPPDEIVVVQDGGPRLNVPKPARIYRLPWTVGFAAAFNLGLAVTKNERVLYLASDDRLLPDAIKFCLKSWEENHDPLGWYYLPIRYSDGREQAGATSAAMVTKALWDFCGGYPPESAVGMPDSTLISALLANMGGRWPGKFYRICQDPVYWVRVHEDQETSTHGQRWSGISQQVRDKFTELWRPLV